MPHLWYRHVVVGSVEDGGVVVDVLDLDGDGAHVLQRRLAVVRGLHRHVHLLLAVGLVSVEHLKWLGGQQDSKFQERFMVGQRFEARGLEPA